LDGSTLQAAGFAVGLAVALAVALADADADGDALGEAEGRGEPDGVPVCWAESGRAEAGPAAAAPCWVGDEQAATMRPSAMAGAIMARWRRRTAAFCSWM
jgi:hypothetical protein